MLYAHPTIFCFRVVGLLSSFEFVVEFRVFFEHSTHTHTHHDAFRPSHDFFSPSFGFVVEFWVFVSNIPNTDKMMFYAHSHYFFLRVLGLLSSFGFVSNIPHTHTIMFYVHTTIFCFRVLGLNLLDFNCRIV